MLECQWTVQRVFGSARCGPHRTGRRVRRRMPTAARRALFRAAEVAGQDRPDDAGQAAHGSALETTDGGRIQEGCDGGANTGTAIENGNRNIEIAVAGWDRTERGEGRKDGVCASGEHE